MRKMFVLLIALCAAVSMSAMIVLPANATGKVKCADNGAAATAVIDPIMHHNQPEGTGHQHNIFGNAAWVKLSNPNTANYNDLEGKATDCRLSADTAGYWQPTVIDTRTGKPLPVHQFTAYYRSFKGGSFGPGQAFPADTRLTAMQWGNSSPGAHGWTCGQFESVRPQATIPDCSRYSQKPGHVLTAHINFPSCWDGVMPNHHASDVGDTSDDAHYAYPVKKVCPKAFPHEMVQLRETIQYPNPDRVPAQYLAVSSDHMMGGSHGSSMHGDFWNAWVQPSFEEFVHDCVNNRGSYSKKACQP